MTGSGIDAISGQRANVRQTSRYMDNSWGRQRCRCKPGFPKYIRSEMGNEVISWARQKLGILLLGCKLAFMAN